MNPLLVIPSILKIFPAYLVACLFLGLIVGVKVLGQFLLGLIPVPFVPNLIVGFLSLYFLTVQMRVLGLMYHANREHLGWFKRS